MAMANLWPARKGTFSNAQPVHPALEREHALKNGAKDWCSAL